MNSHTLPKHSRAGKPQTCSVCGMTGHDKRRHLPPKPTRRCCACKRELPTSEFFVVRSNEFPGDLSVRTKSKCNACERIRCRNRYRSSVNLRLGYLVHRARENALAKKLDFDIDVPYLASLYDDQEGLCYYSGLPLSLDTGDQAISIDRRDPSKGYVKGNVALTSWLVNNMKRHMKERQFVELCRLIGGYTA